jgi:hypothetical protein
MSDSDPRDRHRGVSHHTQTVASLVLGPALVAWPRGRDPENLGGLSLKVADADLDGYAASGLPASTMGRTLDEDRAFFASALAGGTALAGLTRP